MKPPRSVLPRSLPLSSSLNDAAAGTRRVPVWDLPTRVFHWAIVALVIALYVSQRVNRMDLHVAAGETLLALLIFRILWGFCGAETALFRCIASSPGSALRHLFHLARREPDRTVGHNPAGAWMVFVLLGLLLGETLSGLYTNNDVANDGPFTEIVPAPVANAISDLHTILWDMLLGAIALHLMAVLAYFILKRQNLVGPMLTGAKRLPRDVPVPRFASLALALLLAAGSAGAAALMANFF
jgi:cytochrome b